MNERHKKKAGHKKPHWEHVRQVAGGSGRLGKGKKTVRSSGGGGVAKTGINHAGVLRMNHVGLKEELFTRRKRKVRTYTVKKQLSGGSAGEGLWKKIRDLAPSSEAESEAS